MERDTRESGPVEEDAERRRKWKEMGTFVERLEQREEET